MSRRKPQPIAEFRTFPEPSISGLYYTVKVFATLNELHTYVRRREMPARVGRSMGGIVTSWRRASFKRRQGRTLPEMGEIALAKNFLGSEILSHEATHAALGWARRIRLDPTIGGVGPNVSDFEERFCYGLGKIMRGIVLALYDRRLLP